VGIRVLPPEVAAQIAAGEVVERPASVVKELVENALDAEATDIKVEIRGGGQRLIRVIDNGIGIPADEVELAFARHATSKLSTAEDLHTIRTLGFRGEALSSIAAVSRVTLATRAATEAVGTVIRLEGGRLIRREKVGRPRGTAVTVENLFFNTPARLKFLRSGTTESSHALRLVARYALAYPEIRFTALNEGRLVLQTTGGSTLYDALIKVFGLNVAQQMLEVHPVSEEVPETSRSINVGGYIGAPSLSRASRTHLIFFVNRRWVEDRSLSYAVEEAYRTLLPAGRHPVVVLNIQIDPAEVDVNIHPTKREVRFRHPRRVFATVQKAVRHTLMREHPVPVAGFRLTPITATEWTRRQQITRVGRSTLMHRGEWALEVQRTADQEPPTPTAQRKFTGLPMLRVLGQLAQTYIIAEGPDGMYLIDQHTAHERVLYERFKAQQASAEIPSQALLNPITIELAPHQSTILESHQDFLKQLGFDIEPFGGSTYLIRSVPASLVGGDIPAALAEMLEEREESDPRTSWEERALLAVVCHSAVRAGKTLTMEEMRDLVRQLEETSLPHTCPHGRPTMIHLSQSQLEKEFGRR